MSYEAARAGGLGFWSWVAEGAKWAYDEFADGDGDGTGWGEWSDWLGWWDVPCPGAPDPSRAVQALQAAPRQEAEAFLSALRDANGGMGPTYAEALRLETAQKWVSAAWGGANDCTATSREGQRAKALFQGIMNSYGYSYGAPGGGYTDGDTGTSSVWDELGALAKEKARELLGVATQRAAAEIYDTMTPEQRSELRAEILRREAGTIGRASAGPLAIAAGVGLLVFVATRSTS